MYGINILIDIFTEFSIPWFPKFRDIFIIKVTTYFIRQFIFKSSISISDIHNADVTFILYTYTDVQATSYKLFDGVTVKTLDL